MEPDFLKDGKKLNSFTLKIWVVILLTVCYTILMTLVRRFGIGSTHNPLIEIFYVLTFSTLDIVLIY